MQNKWFPGLLMVAGLMMLSGLYTAIWVVRPTEADEPPSRWCFYASYNSLKEWEAEKEKPSPVKITFDGYYVSIYKLCS